MIRKLQAFLQFFEKVTENMNPQHRIAFALALASVGYRCIAWGLRPTDGREERA